MQFSQTLILYTNNNQCKRGSDDDLYIFIFGQTRQSRSVSVELRGFWYVGSSNKTIVLELYVA